MKGYGWVGPNCLSLMTVIAEDHYTECTRIVPVKDNSGRGQLVGGINMPLPKTVITALITEQSSAAEDC